MEPGDLAASKKRRVHIAFGIVFAAGLAGLGFAILDGANACPVAVATAIGAGDRALVACGHFSRDAQSPDLSIWAISLQDGAALRRIAIEHGANEWVTVIGRQQDWLWIRVGSHGLRAYHVPDATNVRVLDGALRRHPVLSRGMTNNASVSAEGAVLQGQDSRDYLVTVDGAIRRVEVTARDVWRARDIDDTSDGTITALRPDGSLLQPDEEALVEGRVLADGGKPLWIDGGRGALAKSTDVIGVGSNDRLSRVDLGGKPVWTVATEQIMAAAGAYHRGCKLQGVHAVEPTVWATIVCVAYSLTSGKRYAHVASRIVAIDSASGKTLRVLEPHPPKD